MYSAQPGVPCGFFIIKPDLNKGFTPHAGVIGGSRIDHRASDRDDFLLYQRNVKNSTANKKANSADMKRKV